MSPLPLAGLRVVVTRAEQQAEGLVEALAAAGARVELLPLLAVMAPADTAPLVAAAARIDDYRWVVFTSANAVRAFLAVLPRRWPGGVAVAAIGPATAMALAALSVGSDLVATRSQAEGVLEELLPRLTPDQRVLLPQAADARPALAAGLRAAGVQVDTVIAYRKTLPPETPARAAAIFGDGPLGWVTFTSPSTARGFAGLFGADWSSRRRTLRAASIGPVTSEALRALGVPPAAEATSASEAAIVAAIAAAPQAPGARR